MKGFKTIAFNGIMVAVGVTGASVTPEQAAEAANAFIIIWGVGNAILRAITNSPIFQR